MAITKLISALTLATAIATALGGCGGSGQDGGQGSTTLAAAAGVKGDNNSSNAGPAVTVLSSKPEYVTGGSALIDVAFPSAAAGKAQSLKITLNGEDITSSFSGAGGSAHVLREVREDKVAFHHESSVAQVQDHCILHMEMAGEFTFPPARAELMYDTKRWGHSGSFVLKVE